jgi:hypothetical protein
MKFKKSNLYALPVLDVTALTPDQTTGLASIYDELCDAPLLPFPQMAEDATRAQIDAAFTAVLNLPTLTTLRTLLAQEPVICLRQL